MTNNQQGSRHIAAHRIEPVSVDLTRPDTSAASDTKPRQRTGSLVFAAGVVLVLIAGLVIFWLPSHLTPPSEAPAQTPPVPVVSESPYQQAQLAQARREAQGLLADILAVQQKLEERAVTRWAADAFQDAAALATRGDTLYRQGHFDQALDNYRQALDALEKLEARWPDALAEQLAAGTRALENGLQQEARLAFEIALAIDPGNEQAATGLKRSDVLDRTYPLLQTVEQAFSAGELDQALLSVEQLLALDEAHPRGNTLREQIQQAMAERRFNDHMSRGLLALDAGNSASAIEHFEQALKLKPDHNDAAASLQQARNQHQSALTARTLDRAAGHEQSEQWHQAADLYQQVLASDDTVVAARVGLLRSQARASLDDRIQAIIDAPLRLAADTVMAEATQLLAEARKIEAAGPRLERQATELARTIAQARVPVTVRLRSDNNTSVTLLRVADLGRFDSTEIRLRPGRYVATGSRQGYRDVRVTFEVRPDDTATVTVICTEPV